MACMSMMAHLPNFDGTQKYLYFIDKSDNYNLEHLVSYNFLVRNTDQIQKKVDLGSVVLQTRYFF